MTTTTNETAKPTQPPTAHFFERCRQFVSYRSMLIEDVARDILFSRAPGGYVLTDTDDDFPVQVLAAQFALAWGDLPQVFFMTVDPEDRDYDEVPFPGLYSACVWIAKNCDIEFVPEDEEFNAA